MEDDKETLNDIVDKMTEEATQVSMVDGGRVDTFTNTPRKIDEEDWYKQLFELDDWKD